MRVKIFQTIPLAKPRMTKKSSIYSDAAKKYWAYKDELLLQNKGFLPPEAGSHIIFHLPVPQSLSEKKQLLLAGTPHQVKPDFDNLTKGLYDAFYKNDSHIWDV